jgi:DNA-binding NarL/FixJ family response regulator
MRLDQEPDFEVAALCASLAQARNVDLRKCDLAIIDVYLPDGSGAELIRELHDAVARPIPAIALTEVRDPKVDARASRAGASEVLTLDVGFDDIIEASRRLCLGEGAKRGVVASEAGQIASAHPPARERPSVG